MALSNYSISKNLKFKYKRLIGWKHYLWGYLISSAISLFICLIIVALTTIYIDITYYGEWFKESYYNAIYQGINVSYEDYIRRVCLDSIWKSVILTAIGLIAIIIFMLLLRFTLWLSENLYSTIVSKVQYLKRYIFHGFFFL